MSVPAERLAEYSALVELLCEHGVTAEAPEIAHHIALASLEDHHLWHAMRLEGRSELRRIFETHFPALAAGNDRDMRWKRFLYKRLCGWPGFSG